MISNYWKAVPLALGMLVPFTLTARAEDESHSQTKIVIVDDDPVVVHGSHGARLGYLGVELIEMTPDLRAHYGAPRDAGVLVGSVEADSPASKAGIEVGDIITGSDGERVESVSDLTRMVRAKKAGDSVKIEVSRDRASKTLTATVAERSSSRHERTLVLPDLAQVRPMLGQLDDLHGLRDRLQQIEKRLDDLEKKQPNR
jgi:S1-C subfamily serine protease